MSAFRPLRPSNCPAMIRPDSTVSPSSSSPIIKNDDENLSPTPDADSHMEAIQALPPPPGVHRPVPIFQPSLESQLAVLNAEFQQRMLCLLLQEQQRIALLPHESGTPSNKRPIDTPTKKTCRSRDDDHLQFLPDREKPMIDQDFKLPPEYLERRRQPDDATNRIEMANSTGRFSLHSKTKKKSMMNEDEEQPPCLDEQESNNEWLGFRTIECKICLVEISNRPYAGPREHVLEHHIFKSFYECGVCGYGNSHSRVRVKNHMLRKHGIVDARMVWSNRERLRPQIEIWLPICFAVNDLRRRRKPDEFSTPKIEIEQIHESLTSGDSPVNLNRKLSRSCDFVDVSQRGVLVVENLSKDPTESMMDGDACEESRNEVSGEIGRGISDDARVGGSCVEGDSEDAEMEEPVAETESDFQDAGDLLMMRPPFPFPREMPARSSTKREEGSSPDSRPTKSEEASSDEEEEVSERRYLCQICRRLTRESLLFAHSIEEHATQQEVVDEDAVFEQCFPRQAKQRRMACAKQVAPTPAITQSLMDTAGVNREGGQIAIAGEKEKHEEKIIQDATRETRLHEEDDDIQEIAVPSSSSRCELVTIDDHDEQSPMDEQKNAGGNTKRTIIVFKSKRADELNKVPVSNPSMKDHSVGSWMSEGAGVVIKAISALPSVELQRFGFISIRCLQSRVEWCPSPPYASCSPRPSLKMMPKRRIICQLCGEVFVEGRTEHIYQHLNQRLFECRICKFAHRSVPGRVLNHIRGHFKMRSPNDRRAIDVTSFFVDRRDRFVEQIHEMTSQVIGNQ